MFQPGIHLPAETVEFRCTGWCVAGTVGIFSGTKQVGYLYWITSRYDTELTFLVITLVYNQVCCQILSKV